MTNTSEMFRKSRILIVDDNPANVRLLEAMLEIAGYEDVQGVTDPRLVLSLHREARFDLILLDIRMPHLDGIQVMEQLAGAIKDDYLPVLVLTAEKDKGLSQITHFGGYHGSYAEEPSQQVQTGSPY